MSIHFTTQEVQLFEKGLWYILHHKHTEWVEHWAREAEADNMIKFQLLHSNLAFTLGKENKMKTVFLTLQYTEQIIIYWRVFSIS
jgi:hypothetical protein